MRTLTITFVLITTLVTLSLHTGMGFIIKFLLEIESDTSIARVIFEAIHAESRKLVLLKYLLHILSRPNLSCYLQS